MLWWIFQLQGDGRGTSRGTARSALAKVETAGKKGKAMAGIRMAPNMTN